MINRASNNHPNLSFVLADAHNLALKDSKFDIMILSDIVNDLWDVQKVFEQIHPLCERHTRLILNLHSHLWEFPISIAKKLGLAVPALEQNWLEREDITNMMRLTGLEPVRIWQEFLFPIHLPMIDKLANRFLVRFWPFTEFSLTNLFVACPK